jgi:hypothetical protein
MRIDIATVVVASVVHKETNMDQLVAQSFYFETEECYSSILNQRRFGQKNCLSSDSSMNDVIFVF